MAAVENERVPVTCTEPVAPLAVMPCGEQMPRVLPAPSVKVPAPLMMLQPSLRPPPGCTVRNVATLTLPASTPLPTLVMVMLL